MDRFSSSTELWQVVMTIGPLMAGAVGAGVIRRCPHRFGWVFGAYMILAAMIALAPFVLAGAAEAPPTVLRPVLVEAKVVIAFGVVLLLGAAVLWGRRTRPSAFE